MYAIDLSQITLEEFADIITTTRLTPGRQILVTGIADIMARFRARGITNLADLQKLLRSKPTYPTLAAELSLSVDYLTVLNREINSYAAKPVPLAKLDVFDADALARLHAAGLTSTKDLYAHALTPADRDALAARCHLDPAALVTALQLADLLRITGVGPVFAHLLRQMDVCSPADFLAIDPQTLLDRYQQIPMPEGVRRPNLGLNDIDYARRFSARLTADIVW